MIKLLNPKAIETRVCPNNMRHTSCNLLNHWPWLGQHLYIYAHDWCFIKEIQFFYWYSFELVSLTLCLSHCLFRQTVISETNQNSRPMPFNKERTTNWEHVMKWSYECFVNVILKLLRNTVRVGACAATQLSIGL